MRTIKSFFVIILTTILLTGIVNESNAQIGTNSTPITVITQNVPAGNPAVRSWNAEVTMYFVGINYTTTFTKQIQSSINTNFIYNLPGYTSYTGQIIVTIKLGTQTYIQYIGVGGMTGTWNNSQRTLPIIVSQWTPVSYATTTSVN